MRPTDYDHVIYELSLGKCNWSLRTTILLNSENIDHICDVIDMEFQEDIDKPIIGQFYKEYNFYNLTPDGLLYNDLNAMLMLAYLNDNIKLAKDMIALGADDFDNVASSAACNIKDLEMFKLMIFHGANEFEKYMLYAAEYNNIEVVKLMLDKGANNFNHYMLDAAMCNSIEVVKLMLDKGANNFDQVVDKVWEQVKIINNLRITHGTILFPKNLIHIDIIKLMLEKGAVCDDNLLTCITDNCV